MKKTMAAIISLLVISIALWVLISDTPQENPASLKPIPTDREEKIACQTIDIEYKDHSFIPNKVSANNCDTIRFINNSDKLTWPTLGKHPEHMEYDGFIEQSLAPGKINSFRIHKTGIIYFHNHLFEAANGEIIVNK